MYTFTFDAIGTRWVIDVFTDQPEAEYATLESHVHTRIEEFDKTYSRFRRDSLVTQMAHNAGEYILPDDGAAMLQVALKLYDLTGGTFTPLIGSVLEEAGYDASYSLRPKKLHRPKPFPDVIVVSGRKILLKEEALLDFGALGKGMLIDIVSELLEDHTVTAYCIDAGGDIRYRGKKQLRIGLEHPANVKQIIGVAKVKNQSIAASAGNRRSWGGYHHIIDPHTLTSPQNVLATWVIADSAMVADALATALFLTEPENLRKDFSFSYLRLLHDYSIQKSENFPAELYYNEQ